MRVRRGAAADAVFLNSRGEVTVYSADGDRRWQVNAQTTWQRGGYDGHTAVAPTVRLLGDAKSSLGDAESSLGDMHHVSCCVRHASPFAGIDALYAMWVNR